MRAVIDSMPATRFVHDTLAAFGWEVLVADAQKVKGLAPLTCKTDRSTRGCWPSVPGATSSRRSGCRIRRFAASAIWPATGCTLVRHRTTPKNRIRATLMTFGHPCPVSDLFGHAGRELLDRLQPPIRGGATSTPAWNSSTTLSCRSRD